jgi:shikimate kinase
MPPRNVVLIGSMGAGKTTVGHALADRLGYLAIDTDVLVEEEAGRRVTQIWEAEGEHGFRHREHDAVVRACAGAKRVIACGGGAILQLTNYGLLKGAGAVVYLRAPGDVLWERVHAEGGRPLARDRDAFMHLLTERVPAYESAADLIVDVDGREPDDVAAEIERRLETDLDRKVKLD